MARLGALLGLAASAGVVACSGSRSAVPLRNVVLIVVDTLRQDHLKAYGYHRETAPTLSRLASEGVLWDGVSPTSWTKPAVASIFTGLHPVRHQAFDSLDRLPDEARTLAERLSRRGYRTLGIAANGWLTRTAGFAQGFDEYYSMVDDLKRSRFSTGEEVNSELLPRLKGLQPPFFLFVHYLDPHAPYDPVRDHRGWPLLGRLAARKGGVSIQELRMSEFVERPPQLVEDAIDLYDAEIRQVDDAIGDLLGELRRLGLMDGTLTVVTSDHGEEMQEHGRMGHGQTLYEEVVRVPLVLHGPGNLPAGLRLGSASLLDVAPTILELLRETVPPGELDGVSLAGGMVPADAAASTASPHLAERELLLHLDLDIGGHALALRGDRLKLVLSQKPFRKELFDHRQDPREQASQLTGPAGAASMPALAERLADRYNELSGRTLPRATNVAPEKLEAMAALGYVGAGRSVSIRRVIPDRIRPADPLPDGSLGWPQP